MERGDEPKRCEHCGLLPIAETVRQPKHVVCESPAMQRLFQRAVRFAKSDAPVVLFGESGSGKEIVARVLHANSARADRPFVAVNVGALPAQLLESELFGHARGAFTGADHVKQGLFEAADGGVLFLDEIGEMALSLQVKLLRALQDGEIRRVGDTKSFAVDARILCATHRDLSARVAAGQFRQDLYYRLKVLALTVPPLRERRADILPLAKHFLAGTATTARHVGKDAVSALLEHDWPGNVRELENAVRHAAALCTGTSIQRDDLPEDVLHSGSRPGPGSSALRPLAQVEREHVLAALDACGGSVSETARVLGIGRNTLWRKLKSFG